MEKTKGAAFESLLNMCDAEVAALNANFIALVLKEHDRLKRLYRASPPSDARFGCMLGLKGEA